MASSGIQVVRVITGDHELTALDFQKHYRIDMIHLLDTDRTFENRYKRRSGWPFLILADASGQVVHSANKSIARDPDLKEALHRVRQPRLRPKTEKVDGITYLKTTLERNALKADSQNDRFTAMAVAADGRIAMVYTSLRNGKSDVMMRLFESDGQSREIPVAASRYDEYDADVAMDKDGQPWVCWTSNQRGRYNIFLTNLSDLEAGKVPIQVSDAPDDAMHGRLVCDADNAVWVTYYCWEKMGRHSRDKEIYLRRWADGKLSPEIRVSPTDVPQYEDHTDPAITCLNGGVAVSWSWDYHQPEGYPQDCRAPTIFVGVVDASLAVSRPFPLSGRLTQSMPAMSVQVGDRAWCAWESQVQETKHLCVRAFSAQEALGEIVVLSESLSHVCSPSFAFYKDQKASLVWAETTDGRRWRLMRSPYDFQTHRWGEKQILLDEHNPRFSSAVYDKDGVLRIAYSVETAKGRVVEVRAF